MGDPKNARLTFDFERDINIGFIGAGGYQIKIEKLPAMPGHDSKGFEHLSIVSNFCEELQKLPPHPHSGSQNYKNRFEEYVVRTVCGEEL